MEQEVLPSKSSGKRPRTRMKLCELRGVPRRTELTLQAFHQAVVTSRLRVMLRSALGNIRNP